MMKTVATFPKPVAAGRTPLATGVQRGDQVLADRVTAAMNDLVAAIAAARAIGLRVDLDFERLPGRLPELGPEAETLVGKVDIYRALT
jgi:hypothetical protein